MRSIELGQVVEIVILALMLAALSIVSQVPDFSSQSILIDTTLCVLSLQQSLVAAERLIPL